MPAASLSATRRRSCRRAAFSTATTSATPALPDHRQHEPDLHHPNERPLQSGSLVVRGRITDKHGMFSDSIITFPIANQPPDVRHASTPTRRSTEPPSRSTTSPSATRVRSIVTASIDWGDGTSSQGVVTTTNSKPAPTTGTVSGSHTYAYQRDALHGDRHPPGRRRRHRRAVVQVTVLDPPLSAHGRPEPDRQRGEPGQPDRRRLHRPRGPDTYTATVDWGDGTDRHQPDDQRPSDRGRPGPGVRQPRLRAARRLHRDRHRQEAGRSGRQQNVHGDGDQRRPTVDAGADIPAGPGVPVNINATFSDPGFPVGGRSETYTATIDWGDNTTSPGTVTVTPGSAGRADDRHRDRDAPVQRRWAVHRDRDRRRTAPPAAATLCWSPTRRRW